MLTYNFRGDILRAEGMTVSDTKQKILAALEAQRGIPVSGEALAKELYMSRNAVWRAVNALKKEGYSISASPKVGYRLEDDGAWGAETVKRFLKNGDFYTPVVYDTVSSTFDPVREAALRGEKEGYAVIAKTQTAGRGRRGRGFFSPQGSGVYLSLLLRPDMGAEDALSVTTAAAVAASMACEKAAGVRTEIKWVNDIYIGGRKICGILTEASVDFESGGLEWAILGIGFNLADPEGGFPEEIRDTAASLYGMECPPLAAPMLAAAFLDEFYPIYRSLPGREHMAWYKERSYLDGRDITVHAAGGDYSARAIGVTENAGLLIELPDGERRVLSSGDVSVHAKNGGTK